MPPLYDDGQRAAATAALVAALGVFQDAVAMYALADTEETRRTTKLAVQTARRLFEKARRVWTITC